jgi:lipopolysaccharide export system protein LptA
VLITVFCLGLLPLLAQKNDTLKTDTLSEDIIDSEINYNARDSIRYEIKGKKIILFGDAFVDFTGRTLSAAQIEIDNVSNLVTAFGIQDSTGKWLGRPVFKDGNNEMRCEKIIYNTKTQKGKIFGVLTEQADMFIYGEAIKKDSNNVMYIKNAKCIPCEYEDAAFYFRATKAKVIPDDKIVTGPLFIEVAGLKTPLGLPFGFFPNVKNKSKSGVLIPNFGQSPNQGFYLENAGFYLPINDKTDMEIRGDIYSSGSWAIKTFNRYQLRYRFSGNFNVVFKQIVLGNREIPFKKNSLLGYQKLNNFSLSWIHFQDSKSNPNQRFSANVNVQSAFNNKYNPQNSQQYLTNTFYSNINYSYSFKNVVMSINARHNQNTVTRDMEISFPEITLNTARIFPFKNENRSKQTILDKIGISYTAEAKSFLREKDSVFFKEKSLSNIQYGVRHNIPISTNVNLLKYFTLTPAINFTAVNYLNYINYEFDKEKKSLLKDTLNGFKSGFDVNFSSNLTTKVFGDFYFNSKYLKQIRHFIIPTVGITYHPDLKSDKLGFYKMVQYDTLGNKRSYSIFENGIFGGPIGEEGGALTYSLNNNIEAKIRQKTDTGFVDRKISLLQNLGISGYYSLSSNQLQWSLINVSSRSKIWKNIDVLAASVFDVYDTDSLGNRINVFYSANQKGLLRYVSSQLAVNAAFNNQLFPEVSKSNWSVNVYYTILINKNYNLVATQLNNKPTQQLNVNGNVEVTKKWRLGFTTGFDFTNSNLSFTSFNIYRDLRCWEAKIDWVPFGFNKRYTLGINLKTASLRDIRIPRQRSWFDN